MSNRTTKQEVTHAFNALVRATGGRVATGWNDVGGYALDDNSVYGGYVIRRIASDAGGVSHPFGDTRLRASEFVTTCRFAIAAMRQSNENES